MSILTNIWSPLVIPVFKAVQEKTHDECKWKMSNNVKGNFSCQVVLFKNFQINSGFFFLRKKKIYILINKKLWDHLIFDMKVHYYKV